MRILIVGHRHPWRMKAAVERAFRRAGHTTLLFDDRKSKQRLGRRITQWRALRVADRFSPDFVFLSKCLALDLETVERIVRGRANAAWYHDPQWHRDTDRPDIAHVAGVGRLAQTFFVTGFDEEWRALGLRARFLPAAACREIVPVPVAPTDVGGAGEVAFIGTGYDPARARFLLALAQHVQVRVYGLGWEPWRRELAWNGGPVEGRAFASVCSRARIVLGVNPVRAAGATTYASDRMWMTILGGAFYVGRRTDGVDRLLAGGAHCAWYDDLESCISVVRHYLGHDEERQRVRACGEAWVRAHHTYDQRIGHLLSGTAYAPPPLSADTEYEALHAPYAPS